eukprot:GDKH01010110.1.p2 GENE.GDKH01010110.1~~GDKH01010110.1.p2  ORF type:complete len:93 (-),score=12.31 GDKH01010110.1:68-346(-)
MTCGAMCRRNAGEYLGRGILYLLLGLLTLGKELGAIAQAGGGVLLAAGVGSVVMHYMGGGDSGHFSYGGSGDNDQREAFRREDERDGGYGQF